MTEPAGPPIDDMLTIAQVLQRLKGRVGRTNLVKHLQAVPRFEGAPTHRRNGAKYLFTAADYATLINSLAAPAEPEPDPRALRSARRRLAAEKR